MNFIWKMHGSIQADKTCGRRMPVLPPADAIDFTDGVEVAAYNHLNLALLQRCDVMAPDGSRPLLASAEQWIEAVERNIDNIPAHQVITALGNYDLTHRLVYRRPAPGEFLNSSYMRVFSERLKGNTDISAPQLFGAISDRIRARQHSFSGRPLAWRADMLDRWLRESMHTGSFSSARPLAESLLIASHMLTEDLCMFTPDQSAYKQRLSSHCLQTINTFFTPGLSIQTLETSTQMFPADSRTLHREQSSDTITLNQSLLAFIRSHRNLFSTSSLTQIERTLLSLLSNSPSLHPLARMAFSYEIRNN